MDSDPTTPDQARPPAPVAAPAIPGTLGVPRWLSRLGTVGLVVVCIVSSIMATAAEANARMENTALYLWAVAGIPVGICVAVVLVFRTRYPVAACVVASAAVICFPIDGIGALVALSWVLGTRSVRSAVPIGALSAVASSPPLLRDAMRPAEFTIFALHPPRGTVGDSTAAPWWVYLAQWVIGLALTFLMGWVRRAHAQIGTERTATRRQAEATTRLRGEVARQEEREQFAREVHDTLAHRLSLVSLHSGALEVAAPEESAELRQAAQVVRMNAHQSLEDLRDLIAQLRDPEGTDVAHDGASLAGLPDLLAGSREAGTPLVATVLLGDVDKASPRLTRAVYRILQECLTNVHKHAPGADVLVDLRGGAPHGITMRVTNRLRPTTPPPGSGTGLIGISERARLLGGTAHWGVEKGHFVVDVHLPWSTAA